MKMPSCPTGAIKYTTYPVFRKEPVKELGNYRFMLAEAIEKKSYRSAKSWYKSSTMLHPLPVTWLSIYSGRLIRKIYYC